MKTSNALVLIFILRSLLFVLPGCTQEGLSPTENPTAHPLPIAQCAQDPDCYNDLVCRNGACIPKPSVAGARSCVVVPDFFVGRQGMRVGFALLVRDGSGAPLVPADGVSWTAVSQVVKGGEDSTPTDAVFTLAEPGDSVVAVRASVGAAKCDAKVTVLPAEVTAGHVRVVVVDELTGRPLPGALVATSNATGSIVDSIWTDLRGVALLPIRQQSEFSVSVFHSDYHYLTLAYYDSRNSIRDIVMPLRRTPQERYGGARGPVDRRPVPGSFFLSMSALSAPGLGTDVTTSQLMAPDQSVAMNVEGKDHVYELSANFILKWQSDVSRSEYTAPGIAGTCDTKIERSQDAEEAIRSGLCGTRTVFSLDSDINYQDLKLALGLDIYKYPKLLSAIFNNNSLLQHQTSSVKRDVQFILRATPGASHNDPDYEDTSHYTHVPDKDERIPLRYDFNVNVPQLPSSRGQLMSAVDVKGTVDVPAQGAVVLGIGSAVLNGSGTQPKAVRVRMAPTHHGLEGNPYRLLITAHEEEAAFESMKNDSYSMLVRRLKRLQNKTETVDGAFLPTAEDAYFNFSQENDGTFEGREFRLPTPKGGLLDATVLRIFFTDGTKKRWVILMDPSRASMGFRLPVPPMGFTDRTRTVDGNILAARSGITVQLISTKKLDSTPLNLATLMHTQEASLAHISDFMTALSEREYGHARIDWVHPNGTQKSIDQTAGVTVRLSNSALSNRPTADNHVWLTFKNASKPTACPPLLPEKSQGEAGSTLVRVSFKLPPGCRGLDVEMTATLTDSKDVPLVPPIFTTTTVSIL